MATAKPMARPAEPPRSVRLGSQVAKMVKTSSNVIRSSTRRPCPTEMLEFTLETADCLIELSPAFWHENVSQTGTW